MECYRGGTHACHLVLGSATKVKMKSIDRISHRFAKPSYVTVIIVRLATHIKNPVPMMLMMIPIVKRMANTLFGPHGTMRYAGSAMSTNRL
jgi:hypothetical protein